MQRFEIYCELPLTPAPDVFPPQLPGFGDGARRPIPQSKVGDGISFHSSGHGGTPNYVPTVDRPVVLYQIVSEVNSPLRYFSWSSALSSSSQPVPFLLSSVPRQMWLPRSILFLSCPLVPLPPAPVFSRLLILC